MAFQKPQKSAGFLRQESIRQKLEGHKGKRVSQMPKPAQDELLEAIAQKLGLADENGVIK
jgi:hypothetical protein